jgi:hypothetical protein
MPVDGEGGAPFIVRRFFNLCAAFEGAAAGSMRRWRIGRSRRTQIEASLMQSGAL